MNSERKPGQKNDKKLGLFSHFLLSAADLGKGIAGIIKEDSHKSRTAYWAYIGAVSVITPVCIGLALLPGPNVIGIGLGFSSALLFAGSIKTLSALGLSKWAQKKDEKFLRDVFNKAALMKKYDSYIRPRKNKPGKYYVHKRTLLRDIFNIASKDVHDASPIHLQRAWLLTKKYVVKPVKKGLSAIYNRVAGKKVDNHQDQNQDPPDKPPKPPSSRL